MSTQTNDNDFDDVDDGRDADLPEPARKRLRQLEKENKQIAELQAKNADYERREQIRKAGLSDLNEDQLAALAATHKGESTPEAFRQTAERLKFVEPEPENDPADVDAHQKLADARQGATRVGDTSYEDEVATAQTAEELAAIQAKHGMVATT